MRRVWRRGWLTDAVTVNARIAVRAGRVAFGTLDLAALVNAAVDSSNLPNFFSYFTIQSNLLAIGILLVGGLADPDTNAWRFIRGAVSLYMTITGLVYAILLAHQTVGLTHQWINDVLHRVTPIVLLADWVLFAPWPRQVYGKAIAWLAYPILYLVYSLVRGPIVNFYPYPFVDPRRHGGYGRVTIYSVVLAVCMAALALGVNWIARARSAPVRACESEQGDPAP